MNKRIFDYDSNYFSFPAVSLDEKVQKQEKVRTPDQHACLPSPKMRLRGM